MSALALPIVGDRIILARPTVTRLDLAAYCIASGDRNPIHWSGAAARAAGLPDVIAHGMLTMGIATRALIEWAGPEFRVAAVSVRFSAPLVVPDTIAGVTLTVSAGSAQPSGPDTTLELEVRNGDVHLLTAATVRLSSGTRR